MPAVVTLNGVPSQEGLTSPCAGKASLGSIGVGTLPDGKVFRHWDKKDCVEWPMSHSAMGVEWPKGHSSPGVEWPGSPSSDLLTHHIIYHGQ